MQWLANVSVRRPVFAAVLMLSVVVLGFASYQQLGVDRFPDVEFPYVAVTTVLPGASPEEMETEVAEKIEEAVSSLGGIDELRSISSDGVAQVFVGFVLEKDVDIAAQEVRDKINTILRELPEGVEPPVVQKLDPAANPILLVAVKADLPVRELTTLADEVIRPRIESVNGVGQVTIVGGRKRQVNVRVDPLKLRSTGLTGVDVQRAITSQNLTIPGGQVETGPEQFNLRVMGRVESPEALADVVVRQVDGHMIRLSDVAEVEDGEERAKTAALYNGEPAVVFEIRKQSGSNTVAVVDAVRERVDELQGNLPAGAELEVLRDDSGSIRTAVNNVKSHLAEGALFAALVVLLFLGNLRSTIIAAVAIPISVIGTFALMAAKGFTLNTISMLALALAVGIVIDDAIVVLENIYRFIDEKGMRPFAAAILATKEIGLAVLATTLSLVAVFLPVAFMSGIVGRFLESFGLTMAFAIMVSLVVSFCLTPMLSSRWLRPHAASARDGKKPILDRITDAFYLPIERTYMRVLGFVMRHRWVVVVASIATFLSTGFLIQAVAKGFLPKNDEAQFEVTVRTPEGSSLDATILETERVARAVRESPNVVATFSSAGADARNVANLGKVFVRLTDPTTRDVSQDELMAEVRTEILSKLPPHIRATAGEVNFIGGGDRQASVMYSLSGPDLDQLAGYSDRVMEKMKTVPGAVDVDTSWVDPKPELGVHIDRKRAADLGVSVLDIAATLRLLVGGEEVSRYAEGGKQYDIHVRADERWRTDAQGLSLLTVPSNKLGSVPLADVVAFRPEDAPSEILRLNRQRQITFYANVAPGAAENVVSQGLADSIASLDLGPGYTYGPAGRSREQGKMMMGFILAIGLSFAFMYLILAAQFESWLHPITILLALPLTFPFALISLIATGQQLDIYSMLGILVLFGVVKKNAILQIDHTIQLREKGMTRAEAILQANKDRLRPILMTTIAFVAGMIPLVTANGIGAGFSRATAGVIVGGQVLSLLLTLLATPVAYSIFDDWQQKLGKWFGGKRVDVESEEEDLRHMEGLVNEEIRQRKARQRPAHAADERERPSIPVAALSPADAE